MSETESVQKVKTGKCPKESIQYLKVSEKIKPEHVRKFECQKKLKSKSVRKSKDKNVSEKSKTG